MNKSKEKVKQQKQLAKILKFIYGKAFYKKLMAN
jgi:hypothetical protein